MNKENHCDNRIMQQNPQHGHNSYCRYLLNVKMLLSLNCCSLRTHCVSVPIGTSIIMQTISKWISRIPYCPTIILTLISIVLVTIQWLGQFVYADTIQFSVPSSRKW